MNNKHHIALYNNKRVLIDYVPKDKEFRIACMRIIDNGANGIVITPNGKKYEVTQSSRKAKQLED